MKFSSLVYLKNHPRIVPLGDKKFNEWRIRAAEDIVNGKMAPSKSRKVAIVGSRSVGESISNVLLLSPFQIVN